MKTLRHVASFMLAVGLVFSLSFTNVQAEQLQFVDMPNNWSTDALQKAVKNGLLKGVPVDGKVYIKTDNNLTRAQLLTIVNRAFGAETTADISSISDAQGMWFTEDIAKAVHMDTWEKSSQILPNQAATREETFAALAKAFNLSSEKYDALSKFSDFGYMSQENKPYLAAMAKKGYVNGFDGKLNPQSNITRAEFAVMMDNIIKKYVGNVSEVKDLNFDKNVVVNSKNIEIKNSKIKGELVIADGVGDGHVGFGQCKN